MHDEAEIRTRLQSAGDSSVTFDLRRAAQERSAGLRSQQVHAAINPICAAPFHCPLITAKLQS